MTISVSCKVCNRKITNLATSHLCDDGSYVGPTCKKTIDKKVPPMESLILTNEEVNAIGSKIYDLTRGLKAEEKDVIRDQVWRESTGGGNPWTEIGGLVFKSPAHPEAIASIQIESLLKFNEIMADKEQSKHGYEEITEDCIARGVHCYLKLFNDISLNREQLHLFSKKMGLKLLGIAPNEIHSDKLSDFSNFIITSEKSPFPERALMINVSPNGGVNFRCMNLTNDGFEASVQSEFVGLWPRNSRRSQAGEPSFNIITSLVGTVLFAPDPTETDIFKQAFKSWDAYKAFSTGKFFSFKNVPKDSPEE